MDISPLDLVGTGPTQSFQEAANDDEFRRDERLENWGMGDINKGRSQPSLSETIYFPIQEKTDSYAHGMV